MIGLLYLSQAQGNGSISRSIERVKTVERLVDQRIVVEEKRGRWMPSLEIEAVV